MGHQDGAVSFQLIERSFPRPTSMVLKVLKLRVEIFPGRCGRTRAEAGSYAGVSERHFSREEELFCTSLAIRSSPMTYRLPVQLVAYAKTHGIPIFWRSCSLEVMT